MAIFTTADGRQIVGAAQAGNEYKGYATKRDITIQLTANGATQDSLDALEYLKAYALYANSVGKSVFPPTTNIYISNNGTTKTVEADDITVDGQNVSVGGCVWNGTAWDFTNAGQSGGGGSSGGGVLVVHDVDGTLDKTWQEIVNAMAGGGAALVYGSNENITSIQVISDAYYDDEGVHPYIVQIGMLSYTSDTANGYPMLE